jgi:hypothetical protein
VSTEPERGIGPSLGRPSYVAVALAAIALLVLGSILLSEGHYVWGALAFAAIAVVIAATARR